MVRNSNRVEFCSLCVVVVVAEMFLPLLSSCSPKVYPTERTDSVRVEIRERIVHDTATFVIEREVEKNVTKDTISHLENTYGKSDAVVSGGLLHHSLETIPQRVAVPVYIPVRDTTIVERQAETIVQEVERELTAWQRFWISLGKIAFGFIICVVVASVVQLVMKYKKI